jgi:ribosome recycling factor
MRDIRGDLQERLKKKEEQIKLANDHCERMVQQLQKERDARVTELKSAIAMMAKLIEMEQKEIGEAARPGSPKLTLAG